jgi:hypothetical protein
VGSLKVRGRALRIGEWEMLTFFTTAKPFVGHIGVIQRNAIRSWQRLHPDVEVILMGDDAGAAEACAELGVRHIAEVRRNKYGTKYLADIYERAQGAARHGILCHVNCDIILKADFLRAVERVAARDRRFLMAGRRWDVDVTAAIDFGAGDWEARVERLAMETNRQRPPQWIDYFVFSRGLYAGEVPEFVIGRPGWDNWLLWYPLSIGVPVVDASSVVRAVHQNHDYGYHPDGEKGVWEGEEAQENYRLHYRKFATLSNATYVLTAGGVRRNYKAKWIEAGRSAARGLYLAWFGVLNLTRPARHRLGIRKGVAER